MCVWPSLCVCASNWPNSGLNTLVILWIGSRVPSRGLSLVEQNSRFVSLHVTWPCRLSYSDVFFSPRCYDMSSQSSPLCPCPVFFRCLISLLIFTLCNRVSDLSVSTRANVRNIIIFSMLSFFSLFCKSPESFGKFVDLSTHASH